MANCKYDWNKISNEYIHGITEQGKTIYPSLRDLCSRYGISQVTTIASHAKKEQWAVRRERYCNKVSTKTEQKIIENVSNEGSRFNAKCFNISQQMADKIKRMLDDAENPGEISTLSQALKNTQYVANEALGDNTTADGITIKVSVSDAD